MSIETIISFVIVIISLVIHEMAHAYTAVMMGDDTPRFQGRLSINPIKHLEWFGSILLPLLLMMTKSPLIVGWAKPVVFNPKNFQTDFARTYGAVVVALAGPLSNICVAIIIGMSTRLFIHTSVMSPAMLSWLSMIVMINISLALFNLMPIPPLDGHYLWNLLLPNKFHISRYIQGTSMFSFIGIILVAGFIWQWLLEPIIPLLTHLLIGA